jgi:diacylglycerol kinase (ATP)
MRVTLVHNPMAGHDGLEKDDLVRALKKAGHKVGYQSIQKPKKWLKALEKPGDLVAVAGGDGSVARVATALAGRGTPLAILPLGTANNIATSLGIRGTLTEVIAAWEHGHRRNIDIGVASGPWGRARFLEAVGFGLFTQAMALVQAWEEAIEPEHREQELKRDLNFLRTTLSSARSRPWQVSLDGEDVSGEYFLLEIMNIRCIGPNLCLAPEADAGDGRLNLVTLSEQDRSRFEEYLETLACGAEEALDRPIRSGRRVRVLWDGSPLRLDDRIYADASLDDDEGVPVEIWLEAQVELLLGTA